jgi:ubiquinone/menaquinone biosynthesis C-methylase UbiE
MARAENVELTCPHSNMEPYQELTLYQRSAVLMAAAKLELFTALARGAGTAEELASRVSAPVDTIGRLLAALAALEYVSRDGERFALNEFSRAFLRDGAGGMARLAWKEHLFYAAWSRLADAISTGNALFPSFADRVAHDLPSVEKFLLALNDLAEMSAPGVIATRAFEGATTILDLGGGGGGYSAQLARALPDTRVTLADLPEITPIAKRYLGRKGIGDRIELAPANFLKDDCGLGGRTFDCVFVSHVLHDFDASTASVIVARAAKLVRPGGNLVILDVLAPEGGHNNPVEALFDLMMLVEVSGGRTHRISDVCKWIALAELQPPKYHKLYFGILLESTRSDQ